MGPSRSRQVGSKGAGASNLWLTLRIPVMPMARGGGPLNSVPGFSKCVRSWTAQQGDFCQLPRTSHAAGGAHDRRLAHLWVTAPSPPDLPEEAAGPEIRWVSWDRTSRFPPPDTSSPASPSLCLAVQNTGWRKQLIPSISSFAAGLQVAAAFPPASQNPPFCNACIGWGKVPCKDTPYESCVGQRCFV